MSNPGKGGRGKLAPYKSVHYRIPSPIKTTVENLANAYRLLAGVKDWNKCNELLRNVSREILNITEVDKNEAVDYTKKIADLEKENTKLKDECRKAIDILVPALDLKPQQGRKAQDAIKEAISVIDHCTKQS